MAVMSVKIAFLGMPNKVGRSAYLIKGSRKVLLDYGVDLGKTPQFPDPVDVSSLDLFVISHSHLDHMGAAPMLYVSGDVPAITTPPSIEISDLLIRDFMKLSGEYLLFEYIDFISLRRNVHLLGYREPFVFDGVSVTLFDAGHIPGSAQVLVEMDGRRILYTGDINTYETMLQGPADMDLGVELDAVIMESTYGNSRHPDRGEMERRFVEQAIETIESGGTVLVPAFAVARSQEILLILDKYDFPYEIVMDGMAIEVTKILLSQPGYLKDPERLRRAFNAVRKIYRWRDRKRVVNERCLIIAPAGMLGGGAAVFYLNKLIDDPKNRIFLVGYQAPGTPGRSLLEEAESEEARDRADVVYMRFSAHADVDGLFRFASSVEGDPTFYIVHGDGDARMNIGELISDRLGYRVVYPGHREEYIV